MGYLEVMVLGDVPAQSVAHLDWRWLKAVAMLQQVGEVFPGMAGVGVEQRDLMVAIDGKDPRGKDRSPGLLVICRIKGFMNA